MISLRVKKGSEFVADYSFTKSEVTVGRVADSDMVLDLPTISRKHATITLDRNGYGILDQSAFGTLVNKRSIQSSRLKTGDVVSIFPFTITVSRIVYDSTVASIADDYVRRGEDPLDPGMSYDEVESILGFAPFAAMDPKNFPDKLPLRAVIEHDTAIRNYSSGDLIIRRGDYGNTAFYIVSGRVQVDYGKLPSSLLGHRQRKRKSWPRAVAQMWENPGLPEVRSMDSYKTDARLGYRQSDDSKTRIFLQDISSIVDITELVTLESGEFFGEISALGRTPRSATIIADGEVSVLEIRWKALRNLRRYDEAIREHIDEIYRKRSLDSHLLSTPIFRHVSNEIRGEIKKETTFETYGNFDWNTSYNQYAKRGSDYSISSEPIIAQEGDYPNGLILIRSGFARVSRKVASGHHTVTYLGRGDVFGFQELLEGWRKETTAVLRCTLRAIGYVDILLIPTRLIEKYLLPSIPHADVESIVSRIDQNVLPEKAGVSAHQINQETLESLVENRFINGTATMMIDLDRCTRCDDCVRACGAAHDNNPRFIRHGKVIGKHMVANACMHCTDPVCMIGCPTGAIHRSEAGGEILINDITCIGCGTCANSCPYDNIRMVEINDDNGDMILDKVTHDPVKKATKCDLCVDQLGGPACERACPHDALGRIDMRDLESLGSWLNR